MPGSILIIEDDQSSLELVDYLCRIAGYRTLTAVDGEQGLAIARSQRPDLVLCDLQMPIVDGYAVLKGLKEDPAWRSIPIVAVTAFSMAKDQKRALVAGFDGFMSKPIDPETFLQQIAEFVRLFPR